MAFLFLGATPAVQVEGKTGDMRDKVIGIEGIPDAEATFNVKTKATKVSLIRVAKKMGGVVGCYLYCCAHKECKRKRSLSMLKEGARGRTPQPAGDVHGRMLQDVPHPPERQGHGLELCLRTGEPALEWLQNFDQLSCVRSECSQPQPRVAFPSHSQAGAILLRLVS